jgi:hypothetical protein
MFGRQFVLNWCIHNSLYCGRSKKAIIPKFTAFSVFITYHFLLSKYFYLFESHNKCHDNFSVWPVEGKIVLMLADIVLELTVKEQECWDKREEI